jgi:hypothetical protein
MGFKLKIEHSKSKNKFEIEHPKSEIKTWLNLKAAVQK